MRDLRQTYTLCYELRVGVSSEVSLCAQQSLACLPPTPAVTLVQDCVQVPGPLHLPWQSTPKVDGSVRLAGSTHHTDVPQGQWWARLISYSRRRGSGIWTGDLTSRTVTEIKANVTKRVFLSWFRNNIPDATQLGRVAFHSPRLGSVTSAVFLCVWFIRTGRHGGLLRYGRREGISGQRNHFYRFSPAAQLRLSYFSPSLADWLEYEDREDKVLSLQSIAVTQHLIPAPLTQTVA